ncbi:MAG: helix-turn-helix domain-containing protein [Crocosphaera sp.]|nr:helix-turn-helix domain-containing protein [Crocosphaera sp.]
MLVKLQNWLIKQSRVLFSWKTEDSNSPQKATPSPHELPVSIKQQIQETIDKLGNNPTEEKAILEALDNAFDRWLNGLETENNSVVILSSPITTISPLISETIKKWSLQKQLTVKVLPLNARPTNLNNLLSILENFVKNPEENQQNKDDSLEVLVIPNLDFCFLRSVEGLDVIEYLQSLLCEHSKQRFWVISANQVSWQYLNSVGNIAAFCGEVFVLPKITSEQLQEWVNSIIESFDIGIDKFKIETKLLEETEETNQNDWQKYFEVLAYISEGGSLVAAKLFLNSLYQKPDQEEDENNHEKLLAKFPELPELPFIDFSQQYILYSLLLHGNLTLSDLAESLGDEQSEVTGQVQVLRRQGIVEEHNKILTINPIYYPQLKQKLSSNNFIIGEE